MRDGRPGRQGGDLHSKKAQPRRWRRVGLAAEAAPLSPLPNSFRCLPTDWLEFARCEEGHSHLLASHDRRYQNATCRHAFDRGHQRVLAALDNLARSRSGRIKRPTGSARIEESACTRLNRWAIRAGLSPPQRVPRRCETRRTSAKVGPATGEQELTHGRRDATRIKRVASSCARPQFLRGLLSATEEGGKPLRANCRRYSTRHHRLGAAVHRHSLAARHRLERATKLTWGKDKPW